jgi:hypothetical protein
MSAQMMPTPPLDQAAASPARNGPWPGLAVFVGWMFLLTAFNALSIADPRVSRTDLLLLRLGLAGPAFLLLAFGCIRGARLLRIAALVGMAVDAFIALCSFGLL